MKILILDDMPERHDDFARRYADEERVHAWTADEAVTALNADVFDLVCLDRDLADNPNIAPSRAPSSMYDADRTLTGEDVAAHIATMPSERKPRRAWVHSWNEPGARRMQTTLKLAGINTVRDAWRPMPDAAGHCGMCGNVSASPSCRARH